MQATVEPSQPTPPALLPGRLIAGRYRLGTIIGRGGMATVWRAHDQRLGRDVAIKISQRTAATARQEPGEARFSGTLIHPNIVSIFDAGEFETPEQAGTYVVMEYVDGATALQMAPVDWRQAVDIVRQASAGLAAIHDHGFVHCDVKPGNLLIDRRGRVLVADLGIATEVDGELGEYVHGSPAYLAPERLTGECATPRVDVYGLGGVLAYLITGQRPTDGPVSLPLSCPSSVAEVIGRARATDPEGRYADARAFCDAITRAVERAERGEDRVVQEAPAIDPGASRQVISHPTRVSQPVRIPTAQETAAMTASPARTMNPAMPHRQPTSAQKHVATVFAATVVVLLLLLVVAVIVHQVMSVDSVVAGPPVSLIAADARR